MGKRKAPAAKAAPAKGKKKVETVLGGDGKQHRVLREYDENGLERKVTTDPEPIAEED